MERRELTRDEQAGIRALVCQCANYDAQCGCLPLDCACYMLGKFWTGAYCQYFLSAVLPLDPVLEVTLTGRKAPAMDTCAACGKAFTPKCNRARYCGPKCQQKGRRDYDREWRRKKRENAGQMS